MTGNEKACTEYTIRNYTQLTKVKKVYVVACNVTLL